MNASIFVVSHIKNYMLIKLLNNYRFKYNQLIIRLLKHLNEILQRFLILKHLYAINKIFTKSDGFRLS